MRRGLARRYGEELGTWLARRVASLIRKTNDPCMDNFRVCDVDDAEELARYAKAEEAGCCGSTYEKITHHATGRTFLFGFNYGH